jgi:hypothetical protein
VLRLSPMEGFAEAQITRRLGRNGLRDSDGTRYAERSRSARMVPATRSTSAGRKSGCSCAPISRRLMGDLGKFRKRPFYRFVGIRAVFELAVIEYRPPERS